MVDLTYLEDQYFNCFIINDFVSLFESKFNLNHQYWYNIIEDNHDSFYDFNLLTKFLLTQIDSCINQFDHFVIKSLTDGLYADVFHILDELDINYHKIEWLEDNNDINVYIIIPTLNIWTICDFRTNPDHYIYRIKKNNFDTFYNNLSFQNINKSYNIIVSLQEYIYFKKILLETFSLYNSIIDYFDDFDHEPHIINSNIKIELSNIIFDIKHELSDLDYKKLLDLISKIY